MLVPSKQHLYVRIESGEEVIQGGGGPGGAAVRARRFLAHNNIVRGEEGAGYLNGGRRSLGAAVVADGERAWPAKGDVLPVLAG